MFGFNLKKKIIFLSLKYEDLKEPNGFKTTNQILYEQTKNQESADGKSHFWSS